MRVAASESWNCNEVISKAGGVGSIAWLGITLDSERMERLVRRHRCALLGRNQCRNTLVFHQEHDELRRFAVARVAADDVNIIRAFIKCFAGFERDGLGALQLHDDRTLEHVDEGMCIVSMDWVSAARRVGDRKYKTFFAGDVRQGFGHDFLYVGRWSGRRELRGERTSGDCDGQ